MTVIDPSFVEKSIELAAPYTASTFNRHTKLLVGSNVVLRGFFLKNLDASGTGISLTIGPGTFISNGVSVTVKTNTSISLDFIPETPYLVYGYTENNRDPQKQPLSTSSSDVVIDVTTAANVRSSYAIIGEISPQTIIGQQSTDAQVVRYFPYAHHSIDEAVSDIKGGVINTDSILGYETSQVISGASKRARLRQGPISMAYKNAIVWVNGIYQEPDQDYTIESPEAITTNAVTSDQDIVDVIVSDDIQWQASYPFSFTGSNPDITAFPFPEDNIPNVQNGTQAVLVFGNGLILSPSRFRYTSDRVSIQIIPNGSGQWVDAAGNTLSKISLVGVRGLRAYESLGGYTLPAVINAGVGNDDAIQVRTPYFPRSGGLQVFADGRIAAVNRGLNVVLPDTPFPDTFYVRESAVGSFEMAREPIDATEDNPPPSWTIENVNDVVLVQFDAAYRNNVYYLTREAPNAFQYLDDILNTGIYEAVFDTQGKRAGGASGSSTPELAEVPHGQNPFLTFYDIIGRDVGNGAADPRDVTILRYANLDYLADVPDNFGSAVSAGSSIRFGGLLGSGTGTAPLPKGGDGTSITRNLQVAPSNWFSSENPVMTMASTDNYLTQLFNYLGVSDRNFSGGQAGASVAGVGGDLTKIGAANADALNVLLKKMIDHVGTVTAVQTHNIYFGFVPTPCVISLETGAVRTVGAGNWRVLQFTNVQPSTNFFAAFNSTGIQPDEMALAAVFGDSGGIQRPDLYTGSSGFAHHETDFGIGAGPGGVTNRYTYGPLTRTVVPYSPTRYSEQAGGKNTWNNVQVMLSPAFMGLSGNQGGGEFTGWSRSYHLYYHFLYDDAFGTSSQKSAGNHFALYIASTIPTGQDGSMGFAYFQVRGPKSATTTPAAPGIIIRRNITHESNATYRFFRF